jgi:hypothetical protein
VRDHLVKIDCNVFCDILFAKNCLIASCSTSVRSEGLLHNPDSRFFTIVSFIVSPQSDSGVR